MGSCWSLVAGFSIVERRLGVPVSVVLVSFVLKEKESVLFLFFWERRVGGSKPLPAIIDQKDKREDFLYLRNDMAEESWNRGADETGCQAPENHRLCTNNCGFFGSPTTMNLCSKCYQDLQMKELQESSATPPLEKSLSLMESAAIRIREEKTLTQPAVPFLPSPSSSSSIPRVSSTPVSGKPNRCSSCNKRVGLMGFKCRCGSTFCASHRLPEKHVCSFDFKAAGREAIAKANPVVKADKLEKI